MVRHIFMHQQLVKEMTKSLQEFVHLIVNKIA